MEVKSCSAVEASQVMKTIVEMAAGTHPYVPLSDWNIEILEHAHQHWSERVKVERERKNIVAELNFMEMRDGAAAELLARKLRE